MSARIAMKMRGSEKDSAKPMDEETRAAIVGPNFPGTPVYVFERDEDRGTLASASEAGGLRIDHPAFPMAVSEGIIYIPLDGLEAAEMSLKMNKRVVEKVEKSLRSRDLGATHRAPPRAQTQAEAAVALLAEDVARARRVRYLMSDEMFDIVLDAKLRETGGSAIVVEPSRSRNSALIMPLCARDPTRLRAMAVLVMIPTVGDDGRSDGGESPHWVVYVAFPDGSVCYADPLHRHSARGVLAVRPDGEIARRLAGSMSEPAIAVTLAKALPTQNDDTTCGYRVVDLVARLLDAHERASGKPPSAQTLVNRILIQASTTPNRTLVLKPRPNRVAA